jgi:carboxymethylenebutenolidase
MNNKMITIDTREGAVPCYFTYPEDELKHEALIIVHEIWGLNDHTKDVAERYKNEGFVVLAPDLLSGTGIEGKIDQSILEEMKDPQKKDEAQKKMREILAPINSVEFGESTTNKLEDCFEYLKNNENTDGHVSIIGFCFGGTYAFSLALKEKGLKRAIPYYGRFPTDLDSIKDLNTPILAFYGENDKDLVDSVGSIQAKMDEYNKEFKYVIYKNCGHAFFNDTNKNMYNKEAAEDSWERALEFLRS